MTEHMDKEKSPQPQMDFQGNTQKPNKKLEAGN